MSDLSTGGCFIVEEGMSRAMGSRVKLWFSSDTLRIECMGEIMRGTGKGMASGSSALRQPRGATLPGCC